MELEPARGGSAAAGDDDRRTLALGPGAPGDAIRVISSERRAELEACLERWPGDPAVWKSLARLGRRGRPARAGSRGTRPRAGGPAR